MTCAMPNCPAPVDYEGDYCTDHLLPDESEPTVVDRDVITVLMEMACASTDERVRKAFDRFYRRAVRLHLDRDRLRAELATEQDLRAASDDQLMHVLGSQADKDAAFYRELRAELAALRAELATAREKALEEAAKRLEALADGERKAAQRSWIGRDACRATAAVFTSAALHVRTLALATRGGTKEGA